MFKSIIKDGEKLRTISEANLSNMNSVDTRCRMLLGPRRLKGSS